MDDMAPSMTSMTIFLYKQEVFHLHDSRECRSISTFDSSRFDPLCPTLLCDHTLADLCRRTKKRRPPFREAFATPARLFRSSNEPSHHTPKTKHPRNEYNPHWFLGGTFFFVMTSQLMWSVDPFGPLKHVVVSTTERRV